MGSRPTRPYDNSSGDESQSYDSREHTLRALEGRNDLAQITPPHSMDHDGAEQEDTTDMFLNIAREESVRPSIEDGHEDQSALVSLFGLSFHPRLTFFFFPSICFLLYFRSEDLLSRLFFMPQTSIPDERQLQWPGLWARPIEGGRILVFRIIFACVNFDLMWLLGIYDTSYQVHSPCVTFQHLQKSHGMHNIIFLPRVILTAHLVSSPTDHTTKATLSGYPFTPTHLTPQDKSTSL